MASTIYDSGNLPTYPLPALSIDLNKPDEEVTEAQKFADDKAWFTRMSRWIVLNFYNRNIPAIAAGKRNMIRCNDEIQTNFDFYFGIQENKTFSYTETIDENNTIQAVYNPDQKIRQIVDHAIGNSIKMIQPIKDSMSAKLLSIDSIKGREQLRKKLILKQKLDALIGDVPGVTFAPAGVESIGEDDDIDEILDRFKESEELDFIKLAQSIYYNNNLNKKFEQSAYHEFVANISNFLIDVINGKTEVTFIPADKSIIDNRATDDYLTDALVGGGVQFLSPAEIFSKWGNELTEDQKEHINRMSQKAYENYLECYSYYNVGWDNMNWYYENGKIACATTYWIGKKNLPYRKKKTAFGSSKVQFLNDNDQYHVYDENGKQVMENGKPVMKKGSDIKTEGIWMVHQNTIIGNYCSVNSGYHPIQIRPQGQRQKPILPTVTFVHRLTMGYFRSVVSRLRHYAEERGRIKLKIQELTGRDMGKVYVLLASKLGLTENEAQEVFKDFKTMGFSLINDLGENGDSEGKGITADALDFSLNPSISAYIQLWKEEAMEMESIVSTSSIAMGMQTSTIGKGVQQQSIAQSTLGQLSLYDGLMEHFRRVLQYALNCEKTLRAGKETLIQTGDNEAYLLNLNKDVMYQDLGLWIQPSDALDAEEQQILKDGLFAFGQNGGTLEAAEALLNTMELINFNSKAEGVEHLRSYVSKKKKETAALAAANQQAAISQSKMEITLSKLFDEKIQESKDLNANYRTEVTASLAALSKMHADIEKSSAHLISTLASMQPNTPVSQDVQNAAANEAGAAQ